MNTSQNFNEELDFLAYQYSLTKDEQALADLIFKMQSICKRDAHVWSLRTGVPSHDLESVYLQAVKEAAEDFEPVGLFIKRYHWYKNRKGSDVLKYHRALKRDNFQTISLNNTIKDGEGSEEFGDRIPDKSDFTKILEILESVKEFEQKNPKYGTVIKMLSRGEHKNAIAEFLGEKKYDELSRKHVSLARKTFKDFIKQN
jgi:hypothetical protein